MTEHTPWHDRLRQPLEELGFPAVLTSDDLSGRHGRIASLTIGPGAAIAHVRLTRQRSYEVRVGIPTFGKQVWTAVTRAAAEHEPTAATLLNGQVPEDIGPLFAAAGAVLFPESAGELSLDCSCPGTRVPCGHLVVGMAALMERFETDPFAIFALRGRDRDALLEEIRRHSGASVTAFTVAPEPGLEDVMDDFFGWGPAGEVTGADTGLARPGGPDGLLDEVPPLSVAVRGTPVSELLRPLYRAFMGDPADR
jgi:uncharacterized Zn finger protein